MQQISGSFVEGGAAGIELTFTDPDTGDAVIPSALAWSLTRGDGVIVNDRDDEAFGGSLDSTVTIALSGDDMALVEGETLGERRLLWEATADTALGDGLTFRGVVAFTIEPYKKVSPA